MAHFRPVPTAAVFWGRADVIVPAKDACFFCGRRLSLFCGGCYVAVCSSCSRPERPSGGRETMHEPEWHRGTGRPA
jgi:hypothetical protein